METKQNNGDVCSKDAGKHQWRDEREDCKEETTGEDE